jgi:phasin family protein
MMGKAENFSELNRKNIEAAMRLAQMSIENSQRVMALQNDLARSLFNDGVESARALSAAKDPGEVMRLRAEYAQATTKKMLAAAQQVAEIGNQSRVAFSHMLTEQLASGSQEMADAFQGFFKNLPGQNPGMLEMMQQAMSAANSAFEQIARATTASIASLAETAQPARTVKKR